MNHGLDSFTVPTQEAPFAMPRIVSTVHDPVALAATCRRLALPPPVEQDVQLDAEAVFGWVVPVPGVRHPVVCDTLSGLIAYHPGDNAHDRYARIMRFLERYYAIRAELRREDRSVTRRSRRLVRTGGQVAPASGCSTPSLPCLRS